MIPSLRVLETVRDGCGPLHGLSREELLAQNIADLAGGRSRWVEMADGDAVAIILDHPELGFCQVHLCCTGGPRLFLAATRELHRRAAELTEQPCAVACVGSSLARILARNGWRRANGVAPEGYEWWALSVHERH